MAIKSATTHKTRPLLPSYSNVPIWAVPQLIHTIAHALSGRRFDVDFMEWFLPQYLRGQGHKNLTETTLKAAEFLFELFTEVWMTLGQTVKVPRGNRKFQVLCICHFFNQSATNLVQVHSDKRSAKEINLFKRE